MRTSLRKCSFGQFKININLPVTTLGILVMKLLTVLIGTPSVSCWMLVTISSICRGRTAERSEVMQQKQTQSNRKNCYLSFNAHNIACWTFWYFWEVHRSTLQLSSCFKVGVREWERVRKRRQLMLTHKTPHKLNLDSWTKTHLVAYVCCFTQTHTHTHSDTDSLFKAINRPPAQLNCNNIQVIPLQNYASCTNHSDAFLNIHIPSRTRCCEVAGDSPRWLGWSQNTRWWAYQQLILF